MQVRKFVTIAPHCRETKYRPGYVEPTLERLVTVRNAILLAGERSTFLNKMDFSTGTARMCV